MKEHDKTVIGGIFTTLAQALVGFKKFYRDICYDLTFS
jgi:hypothetical protein